MTQTLLIIAEVFVGIALLLVLIAYLTRWFSPPSEKGPDEILKGRYARGEISHADYRQMAEDLGITIPPGDNGSNLVRDQGTKTSPASRRAVES